MKSIAILHEGNAKPTHDNHLVAQLIQHLGLDINLINFYGMGRKSNFFKSDDLEDDKDDNAYSLLKSRVVNKQIKKILFIIDADYVKNDVRYGGFENTKKALEDIIDQLGFQGISDYYIMCDPITKEGYLESFILSTISSEQQECIKAFLKCSDFRKKDNKNVLIQIYKIAYPKAPYNFEHPYFDELKEKLKNLFEIDN